MMNRTWVFPCWVDPRFQHLQDEEIVLGYHLLIDNLAFKIRITLADERRYRLLTLGDCGYIIHHKEKSSAFHSPHFPSII